MDERRLEIRVGALLLLAVAAVLGLLWLMGELALHKSPSLSVLFAHTGNVVKGAPVKFGGVHVGKVEDIQLDPTRRDEDGNPHALETIVGRVSNLTRDVDQVLNENKGDVRSLATELSAAAKDLRALAAVARRNFEPGGRGDQLLNDAAVSAKVLRKDLPQMSEDAKKTLAQLAALSGQFDQTDMQKLKVAIDRYTAASEKLDRLADRGDRLMAQVESGQGTLGQLQKDPQLYDDLKALVEDLRRHPWKILWKN